MVRWQVEVHDADDFIEAAREALKIQRDLGSEAVVFDVAPLDDPSADFVQVDLAALHGEWDTDRTVEVTR